MGIITFLKLYLRSQRVEIMEVILYSMCSDYKKRWCFLSLEEFVRWIKYHKDRNFNISWDNDKSRLYIGFIPLMDKDDNEESVEDLERSIDKSLRKFYVCFKCKKVKQKQEFNVQKLHNNIFICNDCDSL